MDAIARQPEASGKIMANMILTSAFIEVVHCPLLLPSIPYQVGTGSRKLQQMSFDTLLSILTPNPTALLDAFSILVVFFVLARYGLPAILNMVDQRNQYINENLQKAQQAALQLENISRRASR